jgi:hypothetical protein
MTRLWGLLVAGGAATAGHARADELAGVDLQWHGSARCAQAENVLELARASIDPAWQPEGTIAIRVDVRDGADGGLELSFEAQRPDGTVRRALTAASCDEARRTAALLIALSLGEPAAPALEASGGAAASNSTAVPAEAPAQSTQTKPQQRDAEKPHPIVLATRAAVAPRSSIRSGFTLAIAVGFEAPVPTSATPVFAAWLGWRTTTAEIDVGASAWLAAQHEVKTVKVRIEQLGALLAGCYWFSFGRWELGPSAKVLAESVAAELNGLDAGSKLWLRAAPGLRLSLWLSPQLTLQLAADALFSLHRPRFSTAARDSVRTPVFGVGSQAALTWFP